MAHHGSDVTVASSVGGSPLVRGCLVESQCFLSFEIQGFFPPFLYTFFWWVSFHSKCWLVSFHSKLNHILILFFPNIGVIEHEIYPELWQCRKNTISHRIWGYTLFLDEPICMVPRACAYPFSSRGPSRSPLVWMLEIRKFAAHGFEQSCQPARAISQFAPVTEEPRTPTHKRTSTCTEEMRLQPC